MEAAASQASVDRGRRDRRVAYLWHTGAQAVVKGLVIALALDGAQRS